MASTRSPLSGHSKVAGVVGAPVRHSLSPLIHNAWIAAAGLDAVYVPIEVASERFEAFVQGLRGGSLRGLNITLPLKELALGLADCADMAAEQAGAANLLLFRDNGAVEARNTDGSGLLEAFADQAPSFDARAGPIAILGAGGAARGAVAALLAAGTPEVRVLNRTVSRAEELAEMFGDRVRAFPASTVAAGLADVVALVNATSVGLGGSGSLSLDWSAVPRRAVVMDMVYKPLRTMLLSEAAERGHVTVDGLAMLIGQAKPSFEALFGVLVPRGVDVRALALAALAA